MKVIKIVKTAKFGNVTIYTMGIRGIKMKSDKLGWLDSDLISIKEFHEILNM